MARRSLLMMPIDIYAEDLPAYAGGLTYARVPLARLDEISDGQVVIVGAPVDEGVSIRPGARFGPRAIRLADDGAGPPGARRHLDLGVHPFHVLDVVDVGDIAVTPGDPERNQGRIRDTVTRIVKAGGTPVVLGGDHSIAGSTIAGATGAAGATPHVVQIDAHTDTAASVPGRPWWSHGSPMWRIINEHTIPDGHLSQIGLRGWWPGDEELEWAEAHGVKWWTARQVHRGGIDAILDQVVTRIPSEQPIWISFDIDGIDPSHAPGTGTPEPGGLTGAQALEIVCRLTCSRPVLGFELVEVCPPFDNADITAMLAHRLVMEAISGIAAYRAGAGA